MVWLLQDNRVGERFTMVAPSFVLEVTEENISSVLGPSSLANLQIGTTPHHADERNEQFYVDFDELLA